MSWRENKDATKWLRFAMETDEERIGENGSYHRAQVGLGDRVRQKSKNGMDFIWL